MKHEGERLKQIMAEYQQTIDDAKRYTDLVNAGGWKDPNVDPIKMLTDVLEAHEAICEEERDAGREENDEQRDDEEAEREGELRAILTEIGIEPIDDLEKLGFKELIARLGEHYRSTTRAEVEVAEGKAEEAERVRIELEEKLATVEHELLHARDQLKATQKLLRMSKGERKTTLAKGSPTRERAVKGRGAGPPQRKR